MGILVIMSDLQKIFLTLINVLGSYSNFRVFILFVYVSYTYRCLRRNIHDVCPHIFIEKVLYFLITKISRRILH